MSDIVVQRLTYEDLRTKADLFLSEFHPSRDIPVPIEEIIEFSMGIDIVPLPGLQSIMEYDGLEIDGFTSSNMKEITVDHWIYINRYNRYRFTLAHEVAHINLHRDLYIPRRFNTIDEWKSFLMEFPEEAREWFEWQAHSFAGLILVPSDKLNERIEKHLTDISSFRDEKGTSVKSNPDFCWDLAIDLACKDFQVSSAVIQKRVDKDNLKERFSCFFV